MTKKEIKFRDPVVERVVDKFVSRSDVGYEKYGQTLDNERKTGVKDLAAYLNDVQEELMDALYRLVVSKETGEIGFHERDFKWNGKTYVLVKIQVPSPYSVMPKHSVLEVEIDE